MREDACPIGSTAGDIRFFRGRGCIVTRVCHGGGFS